MTRHALCGSAGSGARRGRGPGQEPGMPGSATVRLTQRKTARSFHARGSVAKAMGESAGDARFDPFGAAPPAASPAPTGRESTMPRSRGVLRSLAYNLTHREVRRPARPAGDWQRAHRAGAWRRPRGCRAGRCAGNPHHQSRLHGRDRLLRHDHPGDRGGPAARRRPGRRDLHRHRTRNLARFRRFGAWRAALGPARLYAATLRGAGRPDRPGLRPDLRRRRARRHAVRTCPISTRARHRCTASASSTPDADGDGRPERERRGKAGASFMAGPVRRGEWRRTGLDLEDRRPDRRGVSLFADHRRQQRAGHRRRQLRQGAPRSSSPPTSTPG